MAARAVTAARPTAAATAARTAEPIPEFGHPQ
jgi:hypothetical protein